MSTELSREEIIKRVTEKGYEVINLDDMSYYNLHVIDKDGYKYSTTLNSVIGYTPLKFSKSNSYTLYNIRNYIDENDLETTLCDENVYVNNVAKLKFICGCGEVFYKQLGAFVNSKQHTCAKCGKKRGNEKHKRTYEEVYNIFKEKGWTLLDDKYEQDKVKVSAINEDDYKIHTKVSNFLDSKVMVFHQTNPYTIENIKTYLKNNKIPLELISEIFNNSTDTSMLWKCDCGQTFNRDWNNVYCDGQIRCWGCGVKARADKQRRCIEDVRRKISKDGNELISNIYENNRSLLDIKCKCGNMFTRNYHDYLESRKCCDDCLTKIRSINGVANLTNGKLSTSLTNPHKNINLVLDEMNIDYTIEGNFKYYSIDTYVEKFNLPIEVMGDYWHANPNKYNKHNSLTPVQKTKITRDKTKHSYIKNNYGFEILYLWEFDCYNQALCKRLIELYIKNNGVLEDYQSFNYYIDDSNNLKFKDNKVTPYFLI